jgi:hypothetical protein
VLRKALLACPKAIAATFLQAFESSRKIPAIAVPFHSRKWRRVAQNHMICACRSVSPEPVQIRSLNRFQIGLWAATRVADTAWNFPFSCAFSHLIKETADAFAWTTAAWIFGFWRASRRGCRGQRPSRGLARTIVRHC